MKLYPFAEVKLLCDAAIASGAQIHQQFLCSHCGTKQTMYEPDTLYRRGTCEACNHTTDIEHDGCNFAAIYTLDDAKE